MIQSDEHMIFFQMGWNHQLVLETDFGKKQGSLNEFNYKNTPMRGMDVVSLVSYIFYENTYQDQAGIIKWWEPFCGGGDQTGCQNLWYIGSHRTNRSWFGLVSYNDGGNWKFRLIEPSENMSKTKEKSKGFDEQMKLVWHIYQP